MVFHMKTTLVIDDRVIAKLKEQAHRQKRTLSELVEMALRQMFEKSQKKSKELPELPSFDGGRVFVDISNRESLYQAMEKK